MQPSSLTAIVATMRPRQWVKNGFVLAPVIFSGHLLDADALLRAAVAAAAFCLASSACYLVNDIADRTSDAGHPSKRLRPVAAGILSSSTALMSSIVLAVLSLAVALIAGRLVASAVAGYLVLTTAYSGWLKTVPVLEAMILAGGFVLRLLAGAEAIPVPASPWLLICGFLLALLLAFSKRVPEAGHEGLRMPHYPRAFLHRTVTLLAAATVIAYVLYTVAPETVANVGSRRLLITSPLVLFGVLRYLLLLDRDGALDPSEILVRDRPLLATVLAWALASAAIVTMAIS